MKKKIVTLLLATCMAATVVGCGGNKGTNDSSVKVEETADNKDSAKDEKSSNSSAEEEISQEPIEYNVEDYVTLGEYKGLEVTVDGDYEVTDDKIKAQVDNQCQNYPEYEDTNKKKVETGDFVNIDYKGIKDGEAFNGGTGEGYVLEIGSGTFIPGFEDGLIGAEVGKNISLDLSFPENYGNSELAGQAVVFEVKVNKIVNKKDMNYDTLTDEYVSSNFGSDNVDAYLEQVRSSLENAATSQKETDTKSSIIEAVVKNCELKSMPEGLLEQRVSKYISQFKTTCENYGQDMETYLSTYYGMTEDDFKAQVNTYMTTNLTTELIFEAIAKAEGIEADEKGFGEYVDNFMASYGYKDKDALYKDYGEAYLKNVYVYEKALEQIVSGTKVTYTNTAADNKEDAATSAKE